TKELDQMSTDTEEILDGVRAWAEENDVAVDSVAASEIVVTLPGEKKLKTNVAISVFARTAHLQAFVIRHPDENSAEFNRWLLQKNLKPGPVTFAIDSLGDVYLRTSVPREHLLDELDALLGAMLDAADSSFNELLLIGFLTGMKKEWAGSAAGSRRATSRPSNRCSAGRPTNSSRPDPRRKPSPRPSQSPEPGPAANQGSDDGGRGPTGERRRIHRVVLRPTPPGLPHPAARALPGRGADCR